MKEVTRNEVSFKTASRINVMTLKQRDKNKILIAKGNIKNLEARTTTFTSHIRKTC